MKNLAIAFVLGIFSIGAVSAQTNKKDKVKTETDQNAQVRPHTKKGPRGEYQKRTPQERAEMQAKRLQTQYSLTDAQVAKIREISLDKSNKMQALKAKNSEKREKNGAEMKAIKSDWNKQLQGILTPDQYAQFEKDRAEKMEKRQANKGKHKGHYKGKMKGQNGDRK